MSKVEEKKKRACRLTKKCEDHTREELLTVAEMCDKEQHELAEEGRLKKYFVSPTFRKHSSSKQLCKWLSYLHTLKMYTDIPLEKGKERTKRLGKRIDIDKSFLEKLSLCTPYEYEGGFIGFYDILYFAETYGSDRLFLPCKIPKKGISEKNIKVLWDSYGNNSRLHIPRGMVKQLLSYKGDWMAIFMQLRQESSKHGNVLFYYPKTNTVERFDPAGSKNIGFNPAKMDKHLRRYFNSYGIKYVAPVEYLPRQGFNAYVIMEKGKKVFVNDADPAGFCRVWADFFLNYKFLHPDIETGVLFKALIELMFESNTYFIEYIRAFHAKVRGVAHTILEEYGYDPKISIRTFFFKIYPQLVKRYNLC